MLFERNEEQARERMELARWICFRIYEMNPYIKKGLRAKTVQEYHRFPWERMTEEEANAKRESCHVSEQEQVELNRIFKEVFGEL